MDLILNNTLTHQTETFVPVKTGSQEVNLYVCGPTVYDRAHLGNLRTYVFGDVLRRALIFGGFSVKTVMNITDIDDKTIASTVRQAGTEATPADLKKFTDRHYEVFLQDLDQLNINRAQIKFVRVSEVISDIQTFIKELLAKGYAYRAEDESTYFSLEKYEQAFSHYGQLVGEKFLTGKQIQTRTKTDEYDKQNPSDFVLWKASAEDGSTDSFDSTQDKSPQGEGKISWPDPELGPGRPGWHIECSAINRREFGDQTIDIHLGGVDLIFPHHSNEIAQSEALTGQPFVKYWLHTGHLMINGQKMAKSLGNFFTLSDLIKKKINPLAYRYLLLQANYQQTLNFTWQSLEAATKGYDNLKQKITNLKKKTSFFVLLRLKLENPLSLSNQPNLKKLSAEAQNHLAKFSTAISRLNTASALAELQSTLADTSLSPALRLKLVKTYDQVLGLKLV